MYPVWRFKKKRQIFNLNESRMPQLREKLSEKWNFKWKKKKLRVPACWMTAFSDRNASRAINEWQYECGCCRPILSPSCNLQHSSSNGNKWRNLRLERCPTQETLKLSTENSQIFRFKISFQKWKKTHLPLLNQIWECIPRLVVAILGSIT